MLLKGDGKYGIYHFMLYIYIFVEYYKYKQNNNYNIIYTFYWRKLSSNLMIGSYERTHLVIVLDLKLVKFYLNIN
jgi:hypothetical protein